MYAARLCAMQGQRVCILEFDSSPLGRATYINQARVHMGYHYPRSLTTALKSAGYFKRFCEDYKFCIYESFEQIYGFQPAFPGPVQDSFRNFARQPEFHVRK